MSESRRLALPDAAATDRLGRRLGELLAQPHERGLTIWLQGQLGAGKTSLVRGLLRSLGHQGRVPSPSYTLVEPYSLPAGKVFHVDLYRLQAESEAEYLGLAELPGPGELLLVEWPERGGAAVAQPDLRVRLALDLPGRLAELQIQPACGPEIHALLENLTDFPQA